MPFLALAEVGDVSRFNMDETNCVIFIVDRIDLDHESWLRECGKPSRETLQTPIAGNDTLTQHLTQYYYTNPLDQKEYHIVRQCIPTNRPLEQCGIFNVNLQITLAQ